MKRLPFAALPLVAVLAASCGDRGAGSAPPPAAAAPSAAHDAVGEAAASYRVTALAAPASVARGGRATVSVEIAMTRPDVHVQQEFPLKVSLAPSAGLKVSKTVLGHADALQPEAKGRRWEVDATASERGPQEVQAALRFAICKETEPAWCVTRSEAVRASVEVR